MKQKETLLPEIPPVMWLLVTQNRLTASLNSRATSYSIDLGTDFLFSQIFLDIIIFLKNDYTQH